MTEFGPRAGSGAGECSRPPERRAPQVRRFAAVGVLNTLIDYVVFVAVSNILDLSLDSVWIAKVISGTVAMANSFYWNRTWVFRSSGARTQQAARFVATTVTAVYGVQATVTHLFAGVYPQVGEAVHRLLEALGVSGVLPALTEEFTIKTVAFALATACSMTFNFLLYRHWVFRARAETTR